MGTETRRIREKLGGSPHPRSDQATTAASDRTVAIVGLGAAGIATAIFAARHHPGLTVLGLDGVKRLGAKILVSGGGRCNVTNAVVDAADFHGANRKLIGHVLKAAPVDATVSFFREIGVALHEEPGGKLFPDSNSARSVLDALLLEASRCGVRVLTEQRVVGIEKAGNRFDIATTGGTIDARRVVLATGGLSLPKSGSDGGGYRFAQHLGHSIVPPTPALVPLHLEGDFHVPLSGVSHTVVLRLITAGQQPTQSAARPTARPTARPMARIRGSMLWTHFGISGPAVLDISRFWLRERLEGRDAELRASFLPDEDFESAERLLIKIGSARGALSLEKAMASLLPARLAAAILATLGMDPGTQLAHLSRADRRRLLHALLDWPLPVTGSRGYNYAEVTAGGVPLDELDLRTMESRRCPGLHLVGEILDVDARIGGFNFQWAWSSAWVAARGLSDSAP
ncbi:MAG: NAD(P)/FAD-dependent oxidoreductase [Acidobacteria bacterium]|nr:NAD(P)/FAD-dependent oxidoreductase [Acidobacteriota bacterium]